MEPHKMQKQKFTSDMKIHVYPRLKQIYNVCSWEILGAPCPRGSHGDDQRNRVKMVKRDISHY